MPAKIVEENAIIKAVDLNPGDFGVIVGSMYSGELVMRTWRTNLSPDGDFLVGLKKGGTWGKDCPLMVRKLPPGTLLEIVD